MKLTNFTLYILASLKQYCDMYHKRINDLENKKYDLEKEVEFRDLQVEKKLRDSMSMHKPPESTSRRAYSTSPPRSLLRLIVFP